MDCLFCKIVTGEIPSQVVFEDEHVIAFKDIDPKAPTHVLLIPKKHVDSLQMVSADDDFLLAHLQKTIGKIANDLSIAENGYRVVTNIGKDGGQTVGHLHYHILGGRQLHWPPG